MSEVPIGSESENLARERGSRTAELVAAARAGHIVRDERPFMMEDRYAIHLVGDRWQRIFASRVKEWLLRKLVLRKVMPFATYVLIRGRFTDDRVVAAANGGVRQLVILGAGFDTFALRFPDLGVRVFEVDLRASRELKEERLAAAGIEIPEHLRFVTVDFESDDLGERLWRAGFDPAVPAVFAWMGVTFYLTREAVSDTLARVGELAAPGSELIFDYLSVREQVAAAELRRFDALLAFVAKHGEPMITRFHPHNVTEELGLEDRWDVVEHHLPSEHVDTWLGDRTDMAPIPALLRFLHLRRASG